MQTNNYHDYVIKDGKFIGKFEEMYRDCIDPWEQSIGANTLLSSRKLETVLNIRRYKILSVVEFGCGFGFYTNMLFKNTTSKILGVDIAETAIKKASGLFPELNFACDSVQNISAYKTYDAILFADVTWYILDDLDYIFDKMIEYCYGKYFLHNLVFYQGTQKYGREYFTNLEEFIGYVPFKLLSRAECWRNDSDTIETATVFKIERK
jgi:SAM-dependent methyltransferase